MSKYRIVQRNGEVHIQERMWLLWYFAIWFTDKGYGGANGDTPPPNKDYQTVEKARAEIDRRLEADRIQSKEPVYTYYP